MKFVLILFLFLSSFSFSQLIINEVQSSNTVHSIAGRYTSDWVEIYNQGASAIDITGYFLSDDSENPEKWIFSTESSNVDPIIEPGKYLTVVCNNGIRDDLEKAYQTSFKLSSSGEEIHLYDPSSTLVSSLAFPAMALNHSYGYNTSGELGVFLTATPGNENDDVSFSSISYLPVPNFNLPSQIFFSEQNVSLQSDSSGTIYYTLDGTNPTESSMAYESPFSIDETTVVKFILSRSDGSRSKIGMRTLLFNINHELPIISVTSENYREAEIGLSKKPDFNGRVWAEFMDLDNKLRFAQYAEYKRSGANSASALPMNGKLKAKKRYGKDHFDNIDGCIFPRKPQIEKVYGFTLRNTSQDIRKARMRGAYCDMLIAEDGLVDFGFQDYRACVVYLNGNYQGLLNIREDDDSDFAKNNYPDNENLIPYLAWPSLDNRLKNAKVADETERNALIEEIDMRDYYLYVFHYHFLWGDEVSPYGYRIPGEKVDWVIHDEDITLAFTEWKTKPMDVLDEYIVNIREYEPFKHDLVQSWCAYTNFMYNTERVTSILNEMETDIESEVQQSLDLYQELLATRNISEIALEWIFNDYPKDISTWRTEVQTIRDFINGRVDDNFQKMMTQFSIPDAPENFSINSSNINHGFVRVQGVKLLGESQEGKFFKDIPIELIAEEKPGFRFSHWEGISSSTDEKIVVSISETSVITAVFEPLPIVNTELYLNEVQSVNDVTYADEFDEYNDWVEIYNPGNEDIDLAGFYFSDNSEILNKWKVREGEPVKTTVPAEGFLVLWLDKDTVQGANHLGFKLKGKDQIYLVNIDGITVMDSLYFDLKADESYGSRMDGGSAKVTFNLPTPNETNESKTFGIDEIKHRSDFLMYPNPYDNKELTLVLTEENENSDIEILNLKGQTLFSASVANQKIIHLNVSLEKGIYMVVIRSEERFSAKKLSVVD